jgi:hypothetical protein
MPSSKDVLRLMESSLSLKKGSLESESSFNPKVESVNMIALREGRWEARWIEGEKQVRLSSFLNDQTDRYGLMLEVREPDRSRSLLYHRDFLSADDARQEIRLLCESATTGKGLRSIGFLGPKWKPERI